jgi:4-hydroxy-3-polyprenylbenzoate decarboxylase
MTSSPSVEGIICYRLLTGNQDNPRSGGGQQDTQLPSFIFPVGLSPFTMPPMHRCLADFLEELSHAGELSRVDDEVDPVSEAADIVARGAQAGGPAILFGAVKGHDLPILGNLLASEGRICRALGIATLDELAERIARLLDVSSPEGWFERLKSGSQPAAIAAAMPREVKSAACQQIVRLGSDINLGELPLLGCGAGVSPARGRGTEEPLADRNVRPTEPLADRNVRPTEPLVDKNVCPTEPTASTVPLRAITSAVVFSAEPDSHRAVAGRFDLQQIDAARLAVCWAAHDDHARLLGDYRARNQKMPLAVVIGGDPAFLLAASAPLLPGSDICALAGLLRGKPLDVVACRGVDLTVPAEAEIVLEGYVDPLEPPVAAGPLCGPTGHATPPLVAAVMHVTAMTQRANPIYAVMVPGRPPHEAITVARAMQRVFLPLARLAMPELIDYDMPEFAAARHWASVSIRKTYAGQGRRAAHAAWGLRPMMFAKTLVVVDEDVGVRDQQAVLAAISANMNPARDVLVDQGPFDPFDPAARVGGLGQRMAIDATRKLNFE